MEQDLGGFADVIIDISSGNVDRVFSYRIPDALKGQVRIGSRVRLPFGKGQGQRTGYVVDIKKMPGCDLSRVREIAELVPKSVDADSRLIKLAWWMKERYSSTMNQALKTVMPVRRRVRARNKKIVEHMAAGELAFGQDLPQDPAAVPGTAEDFPPALNLQQQAILDQFRAAFDAGDRTPFLIHGVTGSGKTELYMEMIRHVTAGGRQAIVLIPEIALTYQTVQRFYRRFGSRISVMHSRLSEGERFDQLEKARRGETDIMIGPRSALFTPFPSPGLIVIDEEHEEAYKNGSTPRYHARETAEKLAGLTGAALVLGSATPSLASYSRAKAGLYRLCALQERAVRGSRPAEIEVTDMRREMAAGNRSIFSRRLQELMNDRLQKGEQILLFINRRGYSNFVTCRSCGEAVRCPHCDVSLTLHRGRGLVCHYCGYEIPVPKVCPACGSSYLAAFGTGTQKVEELAGKLFPQARILRMDLDTTKQKDGHGKILSVFARGGADILIGTQMIVKGHDFPNVTLVGILAADLSLLAPDYRCAESTFALLVQAAGRAGRGSRPGTALIQTSRPEHYSIRAAVRQDYGIFFEQEMRFRRIMGYPPACHMMEVAVTGRNEETLCRMMAAVGEAVERNFGKYAQVIGPVEAPVYRVNDVYRKNLYVKHENYAILIRIQKYIRQRWDTTDACRSLSLQFDYS